MVVNNKQTNKQIYMKKVIAIVFIATLVACGGNASTEVKTDSTAKVDTVAIDSVKK